jgi:hypothetical protein
MAPSCDARSYHRPTYWRPEFPCGEFGRSLLDRLGRNASFEGGRRQLLGGHTRTESRVELGGSREQLMSFHFR